MNKNEKDNINALSNEENVENSKIRQKIQIENTGEINDKLNKKGNIEINLVSSKKDQELKQMENFYNQNEEYE